MNLELGRIDTDLQEKWARPIRELNARYLILLQEIAKDDVAFAATLSRLPNGLLGALAAAPTGRILDFLAQMNAIAFEPRFPQKLLPEIQSVLENPEIDILALSARVSHLIIANAPPGSGDKD
ncbi:MAG: hypothetical protein B7Z66_12265 [Chromatiales bacterium 21-64-14]|nr:MAG: hypothetical protein B7Z66_12265 [Chromatiales bacterium 21-64-14]HQU15493.1 hypothetical protein [Gammaproteobacteria bacterium]